MASRGTPPSGLLDGVHQPQTRLRAGKSPYVKSQVRQVAPHVVFQVQQVAPQLFYKVQAVAFQVVFQVQTGATTATWYRAQEVLFR